MQIDLGKAKELFLAVLEVPGPERIAYLETACAGDTALRQRIEAMLKTHENSGELLTRSPAEMLADANVTEANATAAFSPQPQLSGTLADHERTDPENLSFLTPSEKPGHLGRLGQYEVQEIIGRGGFGIVLKAFDEGCTASWPSRCCRRPMPPSVPRETLHPRGAHRGSRQE